MTLESAVRRALRGAKLTTVDTGVRELALLYAREIDDGADPAKLGPLLLAALDALGLTPKARGTAKGGAGDSAANPLDELRQRRAARVNAAAAVDAAAP